MSQLAPWTIHRVLSGLSTLDGWQQKEVVADLAQQTDTLASELERALPDLDGLARCNAGALLLRLQKRTGCTAFLGALGSDDPDVSNAAFDLMTDFTPEDSGYRWRDNFHTIVRLSNAEVFAAISHRLTGPIASINHRALFICLKHDIAASRPLTRQILAAGSGSQQLFVASWYLHNGRDDGALDVLDALLTMAPIRSDAQDPRWYDLNSSWRALAAFCRCADLAAASRGAHIAMRVVASALDAPDCQRRFEINSGFIDAGAAAEVIGCSMPPGGERLLRRLISSPINDYDRGRALNAFCRASGEASCDFVLTSLGEPAIRKAAAAASPMLAKNNVSARVLEELTRALDQEKRPEVVGAILSAMTAFGENARPIIEAALERADPWERMRLNWLLQGGTIPGFAELLVEAGAADPIDEAVLTDVSEEPLNLFALLWAGGNRLAQIDIKSDEAPPPHHQLLRDLLAIARPAIVPERLSQRHDDNYRSEPVTGLSGATLETDLGTTCIVEFLHQGEQHSFRAYPMGRWLDVASVMAGFNSFMAHIGRDDRCYQLLGDGSYQFFAVAPEAKFRPLADRLRIPIEVDPDRPRQHGIQYVQHVTSQIK